MDITVYPNGNGSLIFKLNTSNFETQKVSEYLRIELNSRWDIIPSRSAITIITHDFSCHELESIVCTALKKWTYSNEHQPAHHQIPVCYDLSLGIDLQRISSLNQRSIDDIIALHSGSTYTVSMLGFLPGFLYLDGLSEHLHCQRLEVPRTRIPAGAVGIGGDQTGIYPIASPGGWNIIGATPFELFRPEAEHPVRVQALDTVRFNPISLEEYEYLVEGRDS